MREASHVTHSPTIPIQSQAKESNPIELKLTNSTDENKHEIEEFVPSQLMFHLENIYLYIFNQEMLANAAIFIMLFSLSLLLFLLCYYILEVFIITSIPLFIYALYKGKIKI